MPRYYYVCLDCKDELEARLGQLLPEAPICAPPSDLEATVLFETVHAMEPDPAELLEARRCPRCDGVRTELAMRSMRVTGYVHGDGYLDTHGARRDMNVHRLTTDDPYAHMRQPGEADDLKRRLIKAGQKGGKGKRHHAVRITPPPPA